MNAYIHTDGTIIPDIDKAYAIVKSSIPQEDSADFPTIMFLFPNAQPVNLVFADKETRDTALNNMSLAYE